MLVVLLSGLTELLLRLLKFEDASIMDIKDMMIYCLLLYPSELQKKPIICWYLLYHWELYLIAVKYDKLIFCVLHSILRWMTDFVLPPHYLHLSWETADMHIDAIFFVFLGNTDLCMP